MRILALDVGDRRIGVAVSDPSGTLASPVTYILRVAQERDIARVLELVSHYEAQRILVGVPYSMSGELGTQAQRVLRFVEALKERSSVPVETWDERLSTFTASDLLRLAGREPSRDKGRLDAASAAVILQAYLDAQRREKGNPAP